MGIDEGSARGTEKGEEMECMHMLCIVLFKCPIDSTNHARIDTRGKEHTIVPVHNQAREQYTYFGISA